MDDEVNAMFDLGAETFALPPEEKMPYHYQQDSSSFGYVSGYIPSFSTICTHIHL